MPVNIVVISIISFVISLIIGGIVLAIVLTQPKDESTTTPDATTPDTTTPDTTTPAATTPDTTTPAATTPDTTTPAATTPDTTTPTATTPDTTTLAATTPDTTTPAATTPAVYTMYPNTNYGLGDIGFQENLTSEQCNVKCDNTKDCVGFVYDKQGNGCYLKNKNTEEYPLYNTNFNYFFKDGAPTRIAAAPPCDKDRCNGRINDYISKGWAYQSTGDFPNECGNCPNKSFPNRLD